MMQYMLDFDAHVASRWKQYSAPPASAMSFTHCGDLVIKLKFEMNVNRTYLLWFRYHHMTIHEYTRDAFGHTR